MSVSRFADHIKVNIALDLRIQMILVVDFLNVVQIMTHEFFFYVHRLQSFLTTISLIRSLINLLSDSLTILSNFLKSGKYTWQCLSVTEHDQS